MAWFRTRCTVVEIALLLVATFLFFRPDWVIDRFYPKYVSAPATDVYRIADRLQSDELLILGVRGESIEGKEIRKVVGLPLGEGRDGRDRIRNSGVTLLSGDQVKIASVKFGSRARKLGVDEGATIVEIKLPNPRRPAAYWGLIPGVLVAVGVWWWQGARQRRRGK
jgi:hypothetical protein